MPRIILGVVFVLLTLPAWPAVAFVQAGAPPNIAFDITKTDIDLVLKNAPPNPPQRQLRVVDMASTTSASASSIEARPTTSPATRSR